MKAMIPWFVLPFALLLVAAAPTASGIEISREGKASLPIVISPRASREVNALANELAGALKRISGGEFAVETGSEAHGIVLGTQEEWPGLLPPPPKEKSPLLAREDYLLKSDEGKLVLIGRTPLAVQDAVWDFLHRLGFRQFFPGAKWEIWPKQANLSLTLNALESPAYYTRKLRVGAVTWAENRAAVEEWKRRNRMISGFGLRSGHAYQRIISENKALFDAHPECLSGTAKEAKLDPSQPLVLSTAAEYAIHALEQEPDADSVSMEPSDGGGWRTDSPLGSPSNQAVTLGNHVARAIQKKFPGRKVGIYAYFQHSPPPTLKVDPNLIVGVATSFIQGGSSVEEIMKGWNAMGAELGVREYWGVSAWDHGLPGLSRASDLDYITRTLPLFHQLGARYWDGEVTDAWGVNGLGFYLGSRLLWNPAEAKNLPALLDDFFSRSFETAAAPMREYFERYLLKSGRPLLSEDLVGRMYRQLDAALKKSPSPEVTARIEDFVVYTRYVELMFAYKNSRKSAAKREAFEAVAQWVNRMRKTFMFDRWTVFREIAGRDLKIGKAEMSQWLKTSTVDGDKPMTSEELGEILRRGIADNQTVSFEPVSFSSDLVPYAQGTGEPGEEAEKPVFLRGTNSLYVYGPPGKSEFEFEVQGGLVYRNRGPVKLRLYSNQNGLIDEPVAEATAEADKAAHSVRLKSPYGGMHRLEISDGSGGTQLSWPAGQRLAMPSSTKESVGFTQPQQLVFFVPRGTKIVGGFSDAAVGKIVTAGGETLFDFKEMAGPGYFSVKVPQGDDGTSWNLVGVRGRKLLLTVPPYFARSPSELLIPVETAHPVSNPSIPWKSPSR